MQTNVLDKKTPLRIKSVIVSNFRGIDYQHEVLNGENFNILGKNETYKTTFLEAITWALNGKYLDNTSKIDNMTPYNKPLDTETSVEIEFDNGFKVCRTWKRSYATSRETGERYLKDPEQAIYIDEVKAKTISEGQSRIYLELGLEEFMREAPKGIDIFMLLFVPRYIKLADNKTMRELFERIVGEPSLQDIIKTYPKDVVEVFANNNHKYDTIVASHTKSKNQVEAEIEVYRNNIALFEREKATQVEQTNIDELIKQKEVLMGELKKVIEEKAKSKDTKLVEIEAKIKEYQRELDELKYKTFDKSVTSNEKIDTLVDKTRNVISKCDETINKIELNSREIQHIEVQVESLKGSLQMYYNINQDLKKQYEEVTKPTFVTAPISKERFDLYEAEEFKGVREQKLDEIREKGKSNKELFNNTKQKIDDLEAEKVRLKDVISKLEEDKLAFETETLRLQKQLEKERETLQKQLDDEYNAFVKDVEAKKLDLTNKISDLNALKLQYDNNVDFDNETPIRQKLSDLEQQIIVASKRVDYNAEIKGLTDKINALQEKVGFHEKVVVFAKRIERDKLVALENMVSSKFGGDIKIKLFDFTQENTIKPTFDILVKDKNGDFSSIFNGINNGAFDYHVLKVTNLIRNYYNVRNSFVLIDEISYIGYENRERLHGLGHQIISTECEK